jgi:hypothetical protein
MRIVLLAACAVYLSASGAAWAADCSKGMLWPYVRSPGDCLTPDEIKAGKTGVYAGPVNTDPDLSAIPRDEPVKTGAVQPTTVTGGSSDGGALIPISIFTDHTTAPPAATCHKGVLWPFVRSDGDCPTAAEKKEGKTVYGNPAAVTPVSVTTDAATGTTETESTDSDTVAAPACHKGALWPFVREPGDCPTDAEKKAAAAKAAAGK